MYTVIGIAIAFFGSGTLTKGGDGLMKYVITIFLPLLLTHFFGSPTGWLSLGICLVVGFGNTDGYPVSEIRAKYSEIFGAVGMLVFVYAVYRLIFG